LYDFVNDASANPTFYADLRNPQSLNKYQYSYNNPLRYVDADGHEAEEPDPPQDPIVIPGRKLPPLVVPGGPAKGPTDQQIADTAQKVWELPDPYLYPISQTIGTAPDPTIPKVPIQDVTVAPPAPKPQALPQPPPPPTEARRHRKGRRESTRPKHEKPRPGRPGTKDRQNPNWRPRERPKDWPKGKPWPPWKKPKDWPKDKPYPPPEGVK
jgi:hypothetical protein